MSIRKGDTVLIIAGKDRGKRGLVEKVMKDTNKVVVTELNMVKRHRKPSSRYPSGGIVEMATPIDRSNVMVVDADTDKPVRSNKIQRSTAAPVKPAKIKTTKTK